MNPIEIPLTAEPDDDTDPVAFADFVLGQLVANAPAFVESSHPAASPDEYVNWRMSKPPCYDLVIAKCTQRRYRHILARIGHHYLDDQLYCGFASRILSHGGHHCMCFIYMGNCADTGFWMRAYSRPADAV